MDKLDNMLKGNKTKEAVEHALDKLCDDIPWSMQCKKLVHKYTDQIVDMMVMEMDPDKMCRQLGLCDTATGENIHSWTFSIVSDKGTSATSGARRQLQVFACSLRLTLKLSL